MKLTPAFFARPTLTVAPELIGATMHLRSGRTTRIARIVELEAYIGEDDPACHAAAKHSVRAAVLYGSPGQAYVYFIYGMYHCFNVVTERKGFPAALLIRAAEVIVGYASDDPRLLSGPGKFCSASGIDLQQNNLSVCTASWHFQERRDEAEIVTSPRIGISKGKEVPWRFYDRHSSAVSGPRRLTSVKSSGAAHAVLRGTRSI